MRYPLLLLASAVALDGAADRVAGAQDRARFLYVAEVAGPWRALSATQPVPLRALMRVAADARLQLDAQGQAAQQDTSFFIVLRDPRTLARHVRRCSAAQPCSGEIPVAQLSVVRTGIARAARTAELYADLGSRDEIRERIRLVGARGSERDVGVVVLTREGSLVDVAPLVRALKRPADGLVARFCSLTDADVDPNECLESRRRLPADCDLSATACELRAAGGYRIDIYARERSMLGSVAVASGFAAVVAPAGRGAAVAQRDSLARSLASLESELSEDERRGLSAAATLAIAGVRR